MVLVFPDSYDLGMSHNGTKVLYHILNRETDLSAERAFAPMPDMAEKMRERGIPLYALESYRPISDFAAIGISLQTELNYTNVPYVLELGGVKAFSRDRAEADPFVIGGGPCMANPEPVADFFDLFVIGDGEILAVEVLRIIGHGRKAGLEREAILRNLSSLKGVYVPRFLAVVESPLGETVPLVDGSQGPYLRAKSIQRAWVEVLNKDDYPVKNLVPHVKLVHDRFSVEVMRGCTQGCRFCQAGYWYRPNRELNADAVVEIARAGLEATGETELGLLSLSTADYGPVEKVMDALIDQDDFEDISLSLPSLRANSFGQGLARKAAALNGGKSATFAPETGSERLRKMINKTISNQDMYEAAEGVFSNGFHNIKLYTMVGMPTENLDDMRAFCDLIDNLNRIGQKYGRKNTIHASIGILVPKPFTPMQWVPAMEEQKINEHIRFVREAFKYVKSVRISWADYGLSHVEAFYSRADRKVSGHDLPGLQAGHDLRILQRAFQLRGLEGDLGAAQLSAGTRFPRARPGRGFPLGLHPCGSQQGLPQERIQEDAQGGQRPGSGLQMGRLPEMRHPGQRRGYQAFAHAGEIPGQEPRTRGNQGPGRGAQEPPFRNLLVPSVVQEVRTVALHRAPEHPGSLRARLPPPQAQAELFGRLQPAPHHQEHGRASPGPGVPQGAADHRDARTPGWAICRSCAGACPRSCPTAWRWSPSARCPSPACPTCRT